MALDFNSWPRRWQNGPPIARKSYSTLSKFYLNTRLRNKLLKASHKGFCTVEELVQEPKEEEEV